jgi:hypothetical protein
VAYTLEKLPDLPVILFVQEPGTDLLEDMKTGLSAASKLLDEQPGPTFLATDFTGFTMSVGDVLEAASLAARGQSPLLHHPKIRENIFVTTDPLMTIAIDGLATATFGRVKLKRFRTLDAALDYCRHKAFPEF